MREDTCPLRTRSSGKHRGGLSGRSKGRPWELLTCKGKAAVRGALQTRPRFLVQGWGDPCACIHTPPTRTAFLTQLPAPSPEAWRRR